MEYMPNVYILTKLFKLIHLTYKEIYKFLAFFETLE